MIVGGADCLCGKSDYHREPTLKAGHDAVNDKASDVAKRIADELASCDVKLVASLPDNWLMGVIKTVDRDERFVHVPVNREELAIGLCSGAYMGAMGSAALMGASGFMTVIYAITKINYTYEIPLFLMLTLRGAGGDHHKHHISNGLYLRPVLDAINMPYQVIDDPDDIGLISRSYHHTRTFSRPMVVLFTRDLLRGARMKYLDAFRTLAKHRKRRDRGHVGRKLRPGLVGGDTRHRGDVLSRCLDEPVDHVFVRPGAGAARAENLGFHGRRRVLHESREC